MDATGMWHAGQPSQLIDTRHECSSMKGASLHGAVLSGFPAEGRRIESLLVDMEHRQAFLHGSFHKR